MGKYNQVNEKQKKEIDGKWVILFFAIMLLAVGILAKFTI